MSTSQTYVKGGIHLDCDVSLYPAPAIQASWPIPNFPAVQAAPHVLSTVAIAGQGAQGLQVAASAALPGGPTAVWTLHHQAYQGTAPATLPTPDVTTLTVTPGATQQVLATINYPLAGATHLVWLQSVEAGVTTVYPTQSITTAADPTQSGISTAGTAAAAAGVVAAQALGAAQANAAALSALEFTGLSTAAPLADSGTGGQGTSSLGSRQDHFHPTDTTRASTAAFGASGTSHAAGLVPDPGAMAGTTRYLREDETWDVPAAPPVFVASGTGHAAGLVPDPGPTAGTTRFLREDGGFAVPPSSGGSGAAQLLQSVLLTIPANVTSFGSTLAAPFPATGGIQVASYTITPTLVGSRIRVRAAGTMSPPSLSGCAMAIFINSPTNAQAGCDVGSAYTTDLSVAAEYITTSLTPIVVSIRMGNDTVTTGTIQASAFSAEVSEYAPVGTNVPLTSTSGGVIAEQILAVSSPTITFSGIPQTFRNLRLVIVGADTNATQDQGGLIAFNGDLAAANYSGQVTGIYGGSPLNAAIAGRTGGGVFGNFDGAGATSYAECRINDYSSNVWQKVMISTNYTTGSSIRTATWSVQWTSTSAITSITLTAGGTAFAIGTRATLYGEL